MCNKCKNRARHYKFEELESKVRAIYNDMTKEDRNDIYMVSSIQNAYAYLGLILNKINGG